MSNSKCSIEMMNWKLNYNGNDDGWTSEVKKYIEHLETTIQNIHGTLELSGVEPVECSHDEVVASCLAYIDQQSNYKATTKDGNRIFYIDMNERLIK